MPEGSRIIRVEVAFGPVEEATTNRGVAEGSRFDPAMDRRAHGDEVPTPRRLLVVSMARKLAESRVVAPE